MAGLIVSERGLPLQRAERSAKILESFNHRETKGDSQSWNINEWPW
jgi:hypothetical protein